MDELKIDLPRADEEQENLSRLHRWLTYEITSSALFPVFIMFAAGYLPLLMSLAAVVFTPYMLWQLFKAGRYGWIAGFFLTVGPPFVTYLLIPEENTTAFYLFSILPLVVFYFYTWVLRLSVGEWLEERKYQMAPETL